MARFAATSRLMVSLIMYSAVLQARSNETTPSVEPEANYADDSDFVINGLILEPLSTPNVSSFYDLELSARNVTRVISDDPDEGINPGHVSSANGTVHGLLEGNSRFPAIESDHVYKGVHFDSTVRLQGDSRELRSDKNKKSSINVLKDLLRNPIGNAERNRGATLKQTPMDLLKYNLARFDETTVDHFNANDTLFQRLVDFSDTGGSSVDRDAIITDTGVDLTDIAATLADSWDRIVDSDSANEITDIPKPEDPWPVKLAAELPGDIILGGLMMVHEREDSVTCGPIMPQGGIQALETMLYTLDVINADPKTKFKIGAHILDDCDKDTYGLEMAVDFIKGRRIIAAHFTLNRVFQLCCPLNRRG